MTITRTSSGYFWAKIFPV